MLSLFKFNYRSETKHRNPRRGLFRELADLDFENRLFSDSWRRIDADSENRVFHESQKFFVLFGRARARFRSRLELDLRRKVGPKKSARSPRPHRWHRSAVETEGDDDHQHRLRRHVRKVERPFWCSVAWNQRYLIYLDWAFLGVQINVSLLKDAHKQVLCCFIQICGWWVVISVVMMPELSKLA